MECLVGVGVMMEVEGDDESSRGAGSRVEGKVNQGVFVSPVLFDWAGSNE